MCSLGIEPTTFIKYTLLVPGWTHFAFRTALILHSIDLTRCWIHSSEIWVRIDMIASCCCCRFVGCTSMMLISRSTTSQRCSIGLRSGDCGGHLSKVKHITIVVVYSKAMHYYNCTFETTVLLNMKIWKVIIIYSHSFCFKEVRFFFFIWTEKKIFLRMWVTKHLLDANDLIFFIQGLIYFNAWF